jgi:shikimate dehydrogenase
MTDGRTQLVGLVGWPVEHSLSPHMHNAVFRSLELNWHYVPLPVAPRYVALAVQALSALGFRGANVTVPHKLAVMGQVDTLSAPAKALGAVNTLVIERDKEGAARVHGDNTDVAGFLGTLRDAGLEPAEIDTAVIVGAGGAARAAAFGLVESGANRILILNRTEQRGEDVAVDVAQKERAVGKVSASVLTPETLVAACLEATVLINATSVGMWPDDKTSIWPEDIAVHSHLTVMDMVYAPIETRLLHQARKSGAKAIDGLGMLVLQGALAFSKWTGVASVNEIVPIMRAACKSKLGARL